MVMERFAILDILDIIIIPLFAILDIIIIPLFAILDMINEPDLAVQGEELEGDVEKLLKKPSPRLSLVRESSFLH